MRLVSELAAASTDLSPGRTGAARSPARPRNKTPTCLIYAAEDRGSFNHQARRRNKMLTKTKIALATALVLGTAAAALANDIETNPSEAQSAREWAELRGLKQKHENAFAPGAYKSLDSASVPASRTIRRMPKAAGGAQAGALPCPTLEGYPDCH
jgi:hypothetical protein